MDTILIPPIPSIFIEINIVSFSIAAVCCVLLGVTYANVYAKSGSRMIRANALFFGAVAILAASDAVTSLIYWAGASVSPSRFFFYKGFLVAIGSMYLLYRLYKGNGKEEKIVHADAVVKAHVVK